MSDWVLVVFGSSGVIGFIGMLLKDKETTRAATFDELKELDDRLKEELARMDKRLDEEITNRKKAEEFAKELEEENKELIKENNWYQERVEELENRVDKLEKELKEEREK